MGFAREFLWAKLGGKMLNTYWRMILRAADGGGGGGGGGGGDDDGGDKPFSELTWDQVIASTKTGKYKTFTVGDMKALDLGTEGIVNMQIVGIDADELADGTGYAPLTFISKETLPTLYRMYPTNTSAGGWEGSELRTYLKGTVKAIIPATVSANIKAVNKYSYRQDTGEYNAETTDDVWIPSSREVNSENAMETSGAQYASAFPNKTSRSKVRLGQVRASAWNLRSANGDQFDIVAISGAISTGVSSSDRAIALGFCL